MNNALNTGMYSKLSGGTALVAALGGTFVYHLQAPDIKALPYVVWNWQAGGQVMWDLVNGLEYVRAYGTSAAQAGTIFNQVDALLNGGTLTVSGYTNFWMRREDNIEFIDVEPDGTKVYTIGALYRIMLDK